MEHDVSELPISYKLDQLQRQFYEFEKKVRKIISDNKEISEEKSSSAAYDDIIKYNSKYEEKNIELENAVNNCGVVIKEILDSKLEIEKEVRTKVEELLLEYDKLSSLGSLAAGLAHEINNPLGVIVQGIQTLLRRIKSGQEKNQKVSSELNLDLNAMQEYFKRRNLFEYLNGINSAAGKISEIVTSLVQFGSDKREIQEHLDINEVIDNAIDLASKDYILKKRYRFREINIIKAFDKSLPVFKGKQNEIEQVVFNILKNAAQALVNRHLEDFIPCIEIVTNYKDEKIFIEISNNGPLIDKEKILHIFDLFHATNIHEKKSGLGLAVSHYIISEKHHGRIKVVQSEESGVKFVIEIPNAK